MRTVKIKVTEVELNGGLQYDIESDGFSKIELLGILQEASRIVIEKNKTNEVECAK